MSAVLSLWSDLVAGDRLLYRTADDALLAEFDGAVAFAEFARTADVFNVSSLVRYCRQMADQPESDDISDAARLLPNATPRGATLWCYENGPVWDWFITNGTADASLSSFAFGHWLPNHRGHIINAPSGEWREAAEMAVVGVVRFFHLFTACVNVEQRSHKPPRQWRRQRERDGLPWLAEYRTIDLSPRTHNIARGIRDEVNGHTPPRRHRVRGHFKQTKRGLFWWHPFWRGRIDRGLIIKDYDVGLGDE